MHSSQQTLDGSKLSSALSLVLLQFFALESIGLSLMRTWSAGLFSEAISYPSPPEYFIFLHDLQGSTQNVSLLAFVALCLAAGIRNKLPKQAPKAIPAIALLLVETGTLTLLACSIFDIAYEPVYFYGAISTGIGSAAITLLWGRRFVQLPASSMVLCSLSAFAITRFMELVMDSLSFGGECLLIVLLPIASTILVQHASPCLQEEGSFSKEQAIASIRANSGIAAATIYIFLISITVGCISEFKDLFARKMIGVTGDILFFSTIVISACFIAAQMKRRPLSIGILMAASAFAPACFFVLLPFLQLEDAGIQFFTSISSFIANVAMWAYLSETCQKRSVPAIFGFGMGLSAHYIGLFIGEIPLRFLNEIPIEEQQMASFVLSLCMMFIIVLAYAIGMSAYSNPKRKAESKTQAKTGRFSSNIALVSRHYGLTEREEEMLGYLARGYSSKSIQSLLHISASTVSAHSGNIYRKLGVHSKSQAADLVRNWQEGSSEDSEGAINP